MRLICPHCDAQYEVADNVIPDEGRDVQCSNCGTTWFQDSAKTLAAAGVLQEEPKTPEASAEPVDVPKPKAADLSSDVPEEVEVPAQAPAENDEADAPEDTVEEETPVPQSTVSEESAAILREEAMRELKARLAEGSGLETQEELGIDEANAEPAPARTVEPVPVPVPVPVPGGSAGVSRDVETSEAVARTVRPNRSKLPDIEEINSTLSAASTRKALSMDEEEGAATGNSRRTGFRIGFIAAMILAVLALGTYIYAPNLAQAYPEAGPALAAYVEQTNGLRIWFDGWVNQTVQSLTSAMDSVVSDS